MRTFNLTYLVRTIMGAGHETTANSLSWALFELTRHPDIQDKLRTEIREKIAEKGNNVFSGQDYESMPYLTAVVKVSRTLRLSLPVTLHSLHCTGNAPSLACGLHFIQTGSRGRRPAALEADYVDEWEGCERTCNSEGTEDYSLGRRIQ
jgi:hypothetical protein